MRRSYLLRSLPILALAALPIVACGDDDSSSGTTTTDDAGTKAPDASINVVNEAGTGDETGTTGDDDGGAEAGPTDTFRLAGIATYDYVNANDGKSTGETTEGLDYAGKKARPIRRATISAMENGTALVSSTTDDTGAFTLDIPNGHSITIRVVAAMTATTSKADGTAPDNCVGASWDVKVVDNVNQNAQYMLDDATAHTAGATGIAISAPLTYTNGAYVSRAAAPFAIMDTIVTEMEVLCKSQADLQFPLLNVKWSISNVGSGNDVTTGDIGTSHYSKDPTTKESELVILGKEDVDTDEYDDHVIAHEFGHYLEDRLFRSDSVGGGHGSQEDLDPTVAFGEGWGNALSGMTFNDPIYVDTSGLGQATDFTIPVNVAPTGDDRGVYSESSVQYLLWSLFDNRAHGNGSIDRIFNIFLNYQKTTPGLTSAQTFISYYNQVYGGTAESVKTLWSTDLNTPYDSLCLNTCSGTNDVADPYDGDNDIGAAYATTRKYPQETGTTYPADFWRLSKPIIDGATTLTSHDLTDFGGYQDTGNKLGAVRSYRYNSATAQSVTISVGSLGAATCQDNVLDMIVKQAGTTVVFDQDATGDNAGCPTVTFDAKAATEYMIQINGKTTALPSYIVNVSHKPNAAFAVTSSIAGEITPNTDVVLPIVIAPKKNVSNMTVNVRGLDGVTVTSKRGGTTAFLDTVRGAKLVQPTTARVAPGAAGWVVVDVVGTVNGRHVSSSYPISLKAKGAKLSRKTIGALLTNANGQHVVSMKAVVR